MRGTSVYLCSSVVRSGQMSRPRAAGPQITGKSSRRIGRQEQPLKPRIFAYVVAIWLLGIIVNLLMLPVYYDVALRDFGLLLAALALGRLSAEYDHQFERPHHVAM